VEQTLSVNANGEASLSFAGDLDRDSLSKDFFKSITQKQIEDLSAVKQLNITLLDVDRADTAGLAWLINIVRDAKTRNIKVIFSNVPDKLLHLADLSGAKEILQG